MNEKTFCKRLNDMENILYEKVFLKNVNINDILKLGLKKHITFILFANIRFNLFHNCLLKAIKNNLFSEDLKLLEDNILKICFYLEETMKIIDDILSTKK